MTIDAHRAFRGIHDAAHNADQRGFAGAVRPEQCEDFATPDPERDVFQRLEAGRIALRQIRDFDDVLHGREDSRKQHIVRRRPGLQVARVPPNATQTRRKRGLKCFPPRSSKTPEAAMTDPFNLQRFIDAQDPLFEAVTAELAAGKKRTHWMWFVFPQIQGLGHSEMARRYAISSVDEARAYL